MTTTSLPADTERLVDSSSLVDDAVTLRRQLDEQGYLFFRGLLPTADVRRVRRKVLEVLQARGWLSANQPLEDGVADRAAYDVFPPSEAAFGGVVVGAEVYRRIYRLEAFHRLAHHQRLQQLYGSLFGGPVLAQPRTIARVMMPSDRTLPTPAHQDFIHVQGSDQTLTAWIPLGDCPVALGGLSVLRGSHRDGLLSYRAASGGAGDLEAYLCDMPSTWVTEDFRAGDVLTFTSQTVHKSLPNMLGERIRLSVDFRYQPASEPIDRASLEPHVSIDTWEDIYRDWIDDDLKYFWRESVPSLSEWNESIRWQKDRIC